MMLRYRADIRTLSFVAFYFAITAYQWVAAPQQWWLAIPLIMTTCIFSWFGAIITHNTIHAPVFHSKTMNRVFQVVLSLTYGSPVSAFVPGHNLSHHKHTQTQRDVMRTSKVRSDRNIFNLFAFAPKVAIAIMKNDQAYVKTMRKVHKSWFRQYVLESVTVFGTTIALFVIDWKKALFYWLIPHLYAAWGIITINYFQHDGCDAEHPYNHSRNFVSPLLNWFAFNNGYHTMHHMRASLHWSLLPAAHAAEVKPHIDPVLDQKSLIVFFVKNFLLPGKRRDYRGELVELPPETGDESWIPQPRETPEDLGAVVA
ncbi:MAG: fatty acid desaturase [Polyangiaceae bacterium]|nr:fatty acid desaturase [Polyangiaceae bacterium]